MSRVLEGHSLIKSSIVRGAKAGSFRNGDVKDRQLCLVVSFWLWGADMTLLFT
jgi:hypothetical protein